jgi:hypothetical protein
MLTRRLHPRQLGVPSSSALCRCLSTTTPAQSPARSPALGDITPEAASTFDTKSREFRERLVAEQEARRRKEQQESTSPATSARDASYSPLSSDPTSTSFLGSLSSQFVEEARAREENSGKKKGPLSSLIYGTAEGRELDKDIERSFSQVLARGKYVHSIVFHEVKPDKVDEYVQLVGNWYPKMASIPENKVNLVGSWRTEVGDCDTFGIFLPHKTKCFGMADRCYSTYLGIPALHRLPQLPPQHPASPRICRLRPQTQNPHQPEENLPHARILLLAHDTATRPRWTLRTPLLHLAPW